MLIEIKQEMASANLKYTFSLMRPLLINTVRNQLWNAKRSNPIHHQICLCERTSVRCFNTGVSTLQIHGDRKGKKKKFVVPPPKDKPSKVKIWKNMTVVDLAKSVQRDVDDVFEAISLTPNCEEYKKKSSVFKDLKPVLNICKLLGYRGEVVAPYNLDLGAEKEDRDFTKRPPPNPKDLVKKPPVVTIMGHVDHGKTTLLDTLRKTSLVKNEHGGITQHIGAFMVNVNKNEKVTFLDTPGHAAFSAMRARGAYVTDIVVLVVAADDGVMEQTVESIRYAREANVPIIVAVNKMDKPNIDIEHVKSELVAQNLHIEDIGGDVQLVYISAVTGQNVEQLVDAILAQAEIMAIKGDPKSLVEGAILESSSDIARGKLATILVQRGTLKKGAYLVAGNAWAKVRTMFDEWGNTVQQAPPGTPVQVIGWKELPSAGDEILEFKSEKEAKEVVAWRESREAKEKQMADLPAIQMKREQHLQQYKQDLEERKKMGHMKFKKRNGLRNKEIVEDDRRRLSIVIKGDVDGSVEAILDVINTYHSNDACILDVVHYGVGHVTENEVELAESFNGIIYSFNVKPLKGITEMAQEKTVTIKEFKVIYKLVEDLKNELSQRLPFVDQEEILGEANVLQQFIVTEGKKKLAVAGCRCTKGILKKGSAFRLVRNEEKIHEGPLASIRHLKDEVVSVKKDVECGIRLEDPNVTFKEGDVLICYVIHKVPSKTDWQPPGF